MKQLTEKEAIALAKTGWWKKKDSYSIALFQLQQRKLCMNISDFHKAVGEALNRPVYNHELAKSDLLLQELLGEREAPSFNDILCMIPEDKLMIVGLSKTEKAE